MAVPKSVLSFLLVNLFFQNDAKSATFENVTVLLTTQSRKFFLHGAPPINEVFIESSDTLASYVNLQPFEIVTIRNEKIPHLQENSVSDLPNTVHLSIISSGIQEIEAGTFKNVPKLDGLSLERNLIEEIIDGVFTNLWLKSLYLNDNRISRIDSGAFNNMTLTMVSLNNNRIARWNSDWFIGSPVGSIYMAGNLVEEIPGDAFNYALQFKRVNIPLIIWNLVLSQNRIIRVHPEAFKHVNGFGYLTLADNQLKDLPGNVFDSVKNINTLDLTNNGIGRVDGLFDDINIHQLILINNSLDCFPTDVFDVSRINYIFLDGNPLTCRCVQIWEKFQLRNNVWVAYNMKTLEDHCVEKN